MKNGTSQAVLVRDLLGRDGPFLTLAEDFLAGRCTVCGRAWSDEFRFVAGRFLCDTCVPGGLAATGPAVGPLHR